MRPAPSQVLTLLCWVPLPRAELRAATCGLALVLIQGISESAHPRSLTSAPTDAPLDVHRRASIARSVRVARLSLRASLQLAPSLLRGLGLGCGLPEHTSRYPHRPRAAGLRRQTGHGVRGSPCPVLQARAARRGSCGQVQHGGALLPVGAGVQRGERGRVRRARLARGVAPSSRQDRRPTAPPRARARCARNRHPILTLPARPSSLQWRVF